MGIRMIIIYGLAFLLGACSVMKDDMLGLERMEYSGMGIRLDGYWWKELQSNVPSKEIYFLYKDGVVIYGGATPLDELGSQEEYYKTESFADLIRKSKTGWGVFQANANELEFEMWASSNGGPLKTVVRSGEIINDETFVITSFLNNYNGKTSTRNDTFYFREFSPKPDSTNTFIK